MKFLACMLGIFISFFAIAESGKGQREINEDYPEDLEEMEDAKVSCERLISGPDFNESYPYHCFDLNLKRRRMNHYLVRTAGTSVNLYCNPKGNPSPTAKWYKMINDTKVPFKQVSNPLMFKDLTLNDEAMYICESQNKVSKIQYEVRLIVTQRDGNKPTITDFANATVVVGQDLRLDCVIDGELHKSWTAFNREQEGEMIHVESRTDNATILHNNHLLVLENVTMEDAGWYTCIAANSIGRVGKSAYVRIVKQTTQKPNGDYQVYIPSSTNMFLDLLFFSTSYIVIL